MGRANKVGLDYFSLDVHLDDKFELIEAEYGLKGFAVAVKLLQKIYGELGYYCEWNADVVLLVSRKFGLGGNTVSDIVSSCIKRGLFDSDKFEKYGILTSHGIQKTYVDACEKRKVVYLKSEYLMLQKSELTKNVVIKGINDGINPINSDINQQRKEKKSIVNNSGINTTINTTETVEKYAVDNLTYLSPRAMQELQSFKEDMSEDVIRFAIDEACDNGKRNWSYVKAILNAYLDEGYQTVGQIKAAKEERKRKQQKASESTEEKEQVVWFE